MTTQLPHEPPQYGQYPAAPPWANPQPPPADPPWANPQLPPAATAPAGPPWGDGTHTGHGQLMVAYPELMQTPPGSTPPSAPSAPSAVPTVIYTFVFGLFGAISAARRSDRAARAHQRRSRYWIAFGVTLVAHTLVLLTAFTTLMWPVYLDYRAAAVTKAVQSNIAQDRGAAGATCRELAESRTDGLHPYSCKLTLKDGRSSTVRVVADADGNLRSAK